MYEIFYVYNIYFFLKLFYILLPFVQISVHSFQHIQKHNYQHVRRDVNLTFSSASHLPQVSSRCLTKKYPPVDLKMQRDNDAGGQLLLSLLLSAHDRMVKYLEFVF